MGNVSGSMMCHLATFLRIVVMDWTWCLKDMFGELDRQNFQIYSVAF